MFGVQLYKNNARALLSRILSFLNLDWLLHALSVRGVYECYLSLGLEVPPYLSFIIYLPYTADRKSVPLFAFTLKDKTFQSLNVFKHLLQKMGLHQAKDSSHLFPSVPAFMTAEMTYGLAKTLGPVDKSKFWVKDMG